MTGPLAQSSKHAKSLRLAGTILALGLLVYLLSQQGWDEILAAIQKISLFRLGAAFGLMMVSRLAVAGRWHVLLRAVGLDITFSQSTRLTFAGLFASNFLPTTIGGDVVRLAGSIQMKFDAAISAASLIVDRLVGMAGMAMALPFDLPSLLEGRFSLETLSHLSPQWGFAVWPAKGFLQRTLETGNRAVRKITQALSTWLGKPRALLGALAFSWVHMLSLFATLAILLEAMGDPLSFWLIAGFWSLVYFVTLLPISINGYGLQELSIALIFTRVGGISEPNALTVALLIRTLFIVASLPGAAFVPGIMAGREPTHTPSGE